MNLQDAEKFAQAVIFVLSKPANVRMLQNALNSHKPSNNMHYEMQVLRNNVKFADIVGDETMRLSASEIIDKLNDPKVNLYRLGRVMSNDSSIKFAISRGVKRYYVDKIQPVNAVIKEEQQPKKKKKKKKKLKKLTGIEADIAKVTEMRKKQGR